MATPVKDYSRTVEETFAIVRRTRLSADALLSLGHGSISAAASALAGATVEWRVPLATPPIVVSCALDVDATTDVVTLTITMAPPVSMTDAVQSHDYYVILEPGSSTSEKRLWRGRWTVSPAPEAV